MYAPSAAIVNPWEYGLAMAEVAVQNGTEVKLNFDVCDIQKSSDCWKIKSASGEEIEAKYVINAAGVNCDEIHNMVAPADFVVEPRILFA